MEPLWSPVVATGGNQRQIDLAPNPRRQAKTVAVGCHRLPETFHGKQGVCRRLPPVAGVPLPEREEVDVDSRRAAISCLCSPGRGIGRIHTPCMPLGSLERLYPPSGKRSRIAVWQEALRDGAVARFGRSGRRGRSCSRRPDSTRSRLRSQRFELPLSRTAARGARTRAGASGIGPRIARRAVRAPGTW
jgi:hypothetical protein